MAQQTTLSPSALPGKTYAFVAKPAAPISKGIGPFTALSVMGTPGMRHSFSAKTPAPAGGTRLMLPLMGVG